MDKITLVDENIPVFSDDWDHRERIAYFGRQLDLLMESVYSFRISWRLCITKRNSFRTNSIGIRRTNEPG